MKTYYKAGSWNVVCDVCGFRFKAGKLKRRWDGLMTCEEDYELDHPQKYLRLHPEKVGVPYVRKEQETYLAVCTLSSKCSYADVGTADCCQADNTSLPYTDLVLPQGTF